MFFDAAQILRILMNARLIAQPVTSILYRNVWQKPIAKNGLPPPTGRLEPAGTDVANRFFSEEKFGSIRSHSARDQGAASKFVISLRQNRFDGRMRGGTGLALGLLPATVLMIATARGVRTAAHGSAA